VRCQKKNDFKRPDIFEISDYFRMTSSNLKSV
jgi:hypothetical protein